MAILVCGGAGYIGSHTVHALMACGEEVIIVDNLQTGHLEAVNPAAKFYEGDIRDAATLEKIFDENQIEAVIHFAADIFVDESVVNPLKYFNNNVGGMQTLLETMVKFGVDKIIFSSTAAVYGEAEKIPVTETDATNPANPYGESKLIMERMIKWVSRAHNLNFVALRYFNAAGTMPDNPVGESPTHLIPLVLQVPLGKRDHITVFGDDYPTPDGTCLRDYIHVMDLADAHILALKYLRNGGSSEIFNLGSGIGFSVKEIIAAAEKVTAQKIKTEIGSRRAGDPAQLIASSDKARKILGWTPKFSSIEKIITDAWAWHVNHPEGHES